MCHGWRLQRTVSTEKLSNIVTREFDSITVTQRQDWQGNWVWTIDEEAFRPPALCFTAERTEGSSQHHPQSDCWTAHH